MAVAPFWSLESVHISFMCLVPCRFLSGQRAKLPAPPILVLQRYT
jgi:hypothetical protein